MKPRTKFQKQVAKLSATLPSLNDKQLSYGAKHCFSHYAVKRYGGYYCTECGHWWKGEATICPLCKAKLEILDSRKRGFIGRSYYEVVTAHRGVQVIRTFMGYANYRIGQKSDYSFTEVTQRWINAEGKEVVIAKPRNIGWYLDNWQMAAPMAIRQNPHNEAYRPNATARYIGVKTIRELRRNGMTSNFHGISSHYLIPALLSNPICETMLKTGQYAMLKYFAERSRVYAKYFPIVKICIRNGYIIKDACTWVDLIQLLERCGKDIRSPKYICPTGLKAAHDYWLKKRNEIIAKERIAKEKEDALAKQDRFLELKSKFFGISASDGEITIRVLESVLEHVIEGEHFIIVLVNADML